MKNVRNCTKNVEKKVRTMWEIIRNSARHMVQIIWERWYEKFEIGYEQCKEWYKQYEKGYKEYEEGYEECEI